MAKWIIRFLGLKGSWHWACKQMDKGHIVYRTTDAGAAKYKLDNENQRRIQWTFARYGTEKAIWKNANIFLYDFECINWAVLE